MEDVERLTALFSQLGEVRYSLIYAPRVDEMCHRWQIGGGNPWKQWAWFGTPVSSGAKIKTMLSRPQLTLAQMGARVRYGRKRFEHRRAPMETAPDPCDTKVKATWGYNEAARLGGKRYVLTYENPKSGEKWDADCDLVSGAITYGEHGAIRDTLAAA